MQQNSLQGTSNSCVEVSSARKSSKDQVLRESVTCVTAQILRAATQACCGVTQVTVGIYLAANLVTCPPLRRHSVIFCRLPCSPYPASLAVANWSKQSSSQQKLNRWVWVRRNSTNYCSTPPLHTHPSQWPSPMRCVTL